MTFNRSRTLNAKPVGPGPIIFWFDRDLRAEDNWALLHAAELANMNTSLKVIFINILNYT